MHLPARNIRCWCRIGRTVYRWLHVNRCDIAGNEQQFVLRLAPGDRRSRGLNMRGCNYRGFARWMRSMVPGRWYEIAYPTFPVATNRNLPAVRYTSPAA